MQRAGRLNPLSRSR